ncbi:SCAN domain-containing protein 3 [Trichonephila clavipes]|uniref:SCAN domain-containing protein 3 n=1 Tax=Trichonephila clavipes TaxID=2585209 RepID=A0A8X6R6F5_TRICX|nr:SCAN domain-containing protein 3 [Trichonephila clavipes]
MKDEYPEMILVHCVIHRENLVAKNITPALNELLRSVVKCINYIKANPKCERLFRQFCENENVGYVKLLLHTGVRWLSKGNCLKRFMDLYDDLGDFLSDKPEMNPLKTVDGKAFVSYLTDIFEKLLQCSNKTLVDAKTKIFGFVAFIEVGQKIFLTKILTSLIG